MEFENYPRITVGEDAFFSYYMLYHYFKVSKIRRKFKISPIVKKAQAKLLISYMMPVGNLKTIQE